MPRDFLCIACGATAYIEAENPNEAAISLLKQNGGKFRYQADMDKVVNVYVVLEEPKKIRKWSVSVKLDYIANTTLYEELPNDGE